MRIDPNTANALVDLASEPLEKLPIVLERSGISFSRFFDHGVWRDLDFSKIDMRPVMFHGAIVERCQFQYGHVSNLAKRNCLTFSENRYTYSGMGGALNSKKTTGLSTQSLTRKNPLGLHNDEPANIGALNELIKRAVRPGENKRLFLSMVDAGIKPNKETYELLLQSGHLHRK